MLAFPEAAAVALRSTAPSPSKTSDFVYPNTNESNHLRFQKRLWKALLGLALAAVVATGCATTSGAIVLQMLSQTEVANQNAKHQPKTVTVAEPYGYTTTGDDHATVARVPDKASFYEYRLPRAFLAISGHSELPSDSQAEGFPYLAGHRKPPADWTPQNSVLPHRNVFVDEPARDRGVDRLFRRSRRKLNLGLGAGSLACLLLGGLVHRMTKQQQHPSSGSSSQKVPFVLSNPSAWARRLVACHHGSARLAMLLFPLVLPLVLVLVAGLQSLASLDILMKDGVFCHRKCASGIEASTASFAVDACLEGCVLGSGGKTALLGAGLWLALAMALGAVLASTLLEHAGSTATQPRPWLPPKLRRWLRLLAITPELLLGVEASMVAEAASSLPLARYHHASPSRRHR